jgi:hypothetical protein
LKSLIQELREISIGQARQDEERRQRVALRIAHVVIDEYQDEDLPPTQGAPALHETEERSAESRTTVEHDLENSRVKRSEADSPSSAT